MDKFDKKMLIAIIVSGVILIFVTIMFVNALCQL
jgi:hypothetical protein